MDNIKDDKIHVIFQKNERIEGYVDIWNGIMEEIYSQEIIDKIGNIMMVTIVNKRKVQQQNIITTIPKLTTNKCLSVSQTQYHKTLRNTNMKTNLKHII